MSSADEKTPEPVAGGSAAAGAPGPPTAGAKPAPTPATPGTAPARPTSKPPPPPPEIESFLVRRRLLINLGWASIAAFLAGIAVGLARFFFPRTLFEPPTVVKVGFPENFSLGVDTTFQKSHRIWVVREPDRFYAFYAKCTHLGCTPVWREGDNKFKCPCHGSGFTKEGINYEGPAPRPLERIKIWLAEDGQLVVDSSVPFRYEMNQWDKPDSYVKYPV